MFEILAEVKDAIKDIDFNNNDKDKLKTEIEKKINLLIESFQQRITDDWCYSYKDKISKDSSKLNTYKRLINGRYNFIDKVDEKYVFSLDYYSSHAYLFEYKDAFKDAMLSFFGENVMEAVVYLNYQNLVSSETGKIKLCSSFLIKKLASVTDDNVNVSYRRLCLYVSCLFLYLYFCYKNTVITVSSSSEQDIATAVFGALISYLGFGVVFLQLSFENLKKTYASHARELLFNFLGVDVVFLFILDVVASLATIMFSENSRFLNLDYSLLQDMFFNASVFSFFYFTVVLFTKIRNIVRFSLSTKQLIVLIKRVSVQDVKNSYSILNTYNDESLKNLEDNDFEKNKEMTYNLIAQNNLLLSIIVVENLTSHLIEMIENDANNESFDELATWITNIYPSYILTIARMAINNNQDSTIKSIVNNVSRLCYTISIYKGNHICIGNMLSLSNELIFIVSSSNKYNLLLETYQFLLVNIYNQIFYNTPQTFQIAYFFNGPKNRTAFEKFTARWDVLSFYSVNNLFNATYDLLKQTGKVDNLTSVELLNEYNKYARSILYLPNLSIFQKSVLLSSSLSQALFLNKYIYEVKLTNNDVECKFPFSLEDVSKFLFEEFHISSEVLEIFKDWTIFLVVQNKDSQLIKAHITNVLEYLRYMLELLYNKKNNIQQVLIDSGDIHSHISILLEVVRLISYKDSVLSKDDINHFLVYLWSLEDKYLDVIDNFDYIMIRDDFSKAIIDIEQSNADNYSKHGRFKAPKRNLLIYFPD